MFMRVIALLVSFCLVAEQCLAQVAGQVDISNMIPSFSAQGGYRPLHLRFLSYEGQNRIRLLLDKGNFADPRKIEGATQELMKHFFIGLSLPDSAFWVNMRPDKPEEMIDRELAKTDLGRIFLETDLQLKKDTAKMTSPRTREGKEYWNKLYKKAEELFGSQEMTIPTLTRPWIVPGEIILGDAGRGAYIYKATLKVMLEQDYLKDSPDYNFKDSRLKELNEYSAQLLRDKIIPRLTKEVNTSKRYAALRQAYYSLIFAQWFKQKFRGSANSYQSLIDSKDLTGLTSTRAWDKDTYYKEYQRSFREGEYRITEQHSSASGTAVRSYFSGGLKMDALLSAAMDGGALRDREVLALEDSSDFILAADMVGGGIRIRHLDRTFVEADQSVRDGGAREEDLAGNVRVAKSSVAPSAVFQRVDHSTRLPAAMEAVFGMMFLGGIASFFLPALAASAPFLLGISLAGFIGARAGTYLQRRHTLSSAVLAGIGTGAAGFLAALGMLNPAVAGVAILSLGTLAASILLSAAASKNINLRLGPGATMRDGGKIEIPESALAPVAAVVLVMLGASILGTVLAIIPILPFVPAFLVSTAIFWAPVLAIGAIVGGLIRSGTGYYAGKDRGFVPDEITMEAVNWATIGVWGVGSFAGIIALGLSTGFFATATVMMVSFFLSVNIIAHSPIENIRPAFAAWSAQRAAQKAEKALIREYKNASDAKQKEEIFIKLLGHRADSWYSEDSLVDPYFSWKEMSEAEIRGFVKGAEKAAGITNFDKAFEDAMVSRLSLTNRKVNGRNVYGIKLNDGVLKDGGARMDWTPRNASVLKMPAPRIGALDIVKTSLFTAAAAIPVYAALAAIGVVPASAAIIPLTPFLAAAGIGAVIGFLVGDMMNSVERMGGGEEGSGLLTLMLAVLGAVITVIPAVPAGIIVGALAGTNVLGMSMLFWGVAATASMITSFVNMVMGSPVTTTISRMWNGLKPAQKDGGLTIGNVIKAGTIITTGGLAVAGLLGIFGIISAPISGIAMLSLGAGGLIGIFATDFLWNSFSGEGAGYIVGFRVMFVTAALSLPLFIPPLFGAYTLSLATVYFLCSIASSTAFSIPSALGSVWFGKQKEKNYRFDGGEGMQEDNSAVRFLPAQCDNLDFEKLFEFISEAALKHATIEVVTAAGRMKVRMDDAYVSRASGEVEGKRIDDDLMINNIQGEVLQKDADGNRMAQCRLYWKLPAFVTENIDSKKQDQYGYKAQKTRDGHLYYQQYYNGHISQYELAGYYKYFEIREIVFPKSIAQRILSKLIKTTNGGKGTDFFAISVPASDTQLADAALTAAYNTRTDVMVQGGGRFLLPGPIQFVADQPKGTATLVKEAYFDGYDTTAISIGGGAPEKIRMFLDKATFLRYYDEKTGEENMDRYLSIHRCGHRKEQFSNMPEFGAYTERMVFNGSVTRNLLENGFTVQKDLERYALTRYGIGGENIDPARQDGGQVLSAEQLSQLVEKLNSSETPWEEIDGSIRALNDKSRALLDELYAARYPDGRAMRTIADWAEDLPLPARQPGILQEWELTGFGVLREKTADDWTDIQHTGKRLPGAVSTKIFNDLVALGYIDKEGHFLSKSAVYFEEELENMSPTVYSGGQRYLIRSFLQRAQEVGQKELKWLVDGKKAEGKATEYQFRKLPIFVYDMGELTSLTKLPELFSTNDKTTVQLADAEKKARSPATGKFGFLAIQVTEGRPDLYVIGSPERFAELYSEIPLQEVKEKNPALYPGIPEALMKWINEEGRAVNFKGALKREATGMFKLSELGIPVDSQVAIVGVGRRQVKPSGKEGYISLNKKTGEYYLINIDEKGNPIEYYKADGGQALLLPFEQFALDLVSRFNAENPGEPIGNMEFSEAMKSGIVPAIDLLLSKLQQYGGMYDAEISLLSEYRYRELRPAVPQKSELELKIERMIKAFSDVARLKDLDKKRPAMNSIRLWLENGEGYPMECVGPILTLIENPGGRYDFSDRIRDLLEIAETDVFIRHNRGGLYDGGYGMYVTPGEMEEILVSLSREFLLNEQRDLLKTDAASVAAQLIGKSRDPVRTGRLSEMREKVLAFEKQQKMDAGHKAAVMLSEIQAIGRSFGVPASVLFRATVAPQEAAASGRMVQEWVKNRGLDVRYDKDAPKPDIELFWLDQYNLHRLSVLQSELTWLADGGAAKPLKKPEEYSPEEYMAELFREFEDVLIGQIEVGHKYTPREAHQRATELGKELFSELVNAKDDTYTPDGVTFAKKDLLGFEYINVRMFAQVIMLRNIGSVDRPASGQASRDGGTQDRMGGIDFRALPIKAHPVDMAAFRALSHSPSVAAIDIDEEMAALGKMTASSILPSPERLKELLAACYGKGRMAEYGDSLRMVVARELRIEEDVCCATDPVLKDVITLLGSAM